MGFKENVSVTLDISANIAQVRSAANELQNILSKSNFSSGFSSKITGMVSQLNDALSQLETKGSKAITGLGDVKGVETSIGKVSTIIRNIAVELDRAGASGSKSLLAMINGMDSKLEQANSAQRQYTKSIQETQSEADKLAKSLDKVQKAQTEAERKSNEALARSNAAKAKIQAAEQTKANLRSSSGRTADSLDSEIEAKMARIKQLQALMSDVAGGGKKLRLFETDKSSFSEDQVKQITEYQNIVSSLTGEVGRLKQEQTALNEEIAKQDEIIKKAKSEQTKADTDQQRSIEDYVKQTAAIQTVQDQIKQLNQTAKDTAAFDEYKQKLSEIFGNETLKNATSIDELNTALERLKESGIKMTADQLQKLLSISSGMGTPLKEMGEKARQAGDGFKQMTDKAQDLDMLTYRLKYFFSMVGGFQLFRRAIRSSIETIKELDAAMTQTAVVSTKTVGQMWKTLPEYTQKAKTLAASIKDVYSAQTLYVQQGLDMDSALGLGVETLKMARVAGIEAAAATDSMTAALRGFKMELNETSAVRINDVYSKLAQNTASNVQEISTAMTKVAALANSANMSFENTAAFLSKIIESTREGAETAGTALKTVIARFTEVKTLYDQGELLGTDEEGQEVDVNKISKALRTAGINMNEFFTGAKGLDEIFIELGKKWDSLTTIQQRYIATQAAGSRQQSRFLALMQDFSRTTELTQMAYNAAGSGQEQFEKTLDSLDAKLTKLKTEWQNFIMGIANSDLVKGFIDFGSKLLETINNVIDKLSGGNGLAKSILSVAAAFGVFKMGGMAVRGILNNVGVALGTRAVGSAGIGAGLVGMKQNFSAFRQMFHPLAGLGKKGQDRIQNKGLESYGEKTSGRYNRVMALQGVQDAATYRDAFDKKSAELAKLKTSEGRAAWIRDPANEKAIRDAGDDEAVAYNKAVQNKQQEVDAAKQDLDNSAQQQTQTLSAYGSALQGIGMAAGIAAGALYLLANKMDDGTEKGERNAKIVKGFATGLTFLSVSLMLVGTAAQIMGAMVAAGAKVASTAIKSIPIIGWALAVISAIISVIQIIRNLNEEKPPEEVWKEFEASCEKAAEGAKKVLDNYKNVLNQIKDIDTQQSGLKELIIGTEEWDTAVKKLNDSILTLIKSYPALADAVKWVNDHWELDMASEAYQDWAKESKRNAANAEVAETAATHGKAREQAKYDIESFQNEDRFAGYKEDTGFASTTWSRPDWINSQGKVEFKPQKTGTVTTHNSNRTAQQDWVKQINNRNDELYGKMYVSNGRGAWSKQEAYAWDSLAKLLGDQYVFDSEYSARRRPDAGSKNVNIDQLVQEAIFDKFGLTKEDLITMYGNLAEPLANAINSGQVSNLGSLYNFYKDMNENGTFFGEGDLRNQKAFDYFTYLIKDDNGNWRDNVPIDEFLSKFSGYTNAVEAVQGSSLKLLTTVIEDSNNLDKTLTNAYLAYGKSKFLDRYLAIDENELEKYEQEVNPRTGKTYASEFKIASNVPVADRGKSLSELELKGAFKEYMRYQLAADNIFSDEEFKEWNNNLESINKKIGGGLDSIFSNDVKNLTIEQISSIKSLKAEDVEWILEWSGLDVSADGENSIFKSYDKMFTGLEGYKDQIEGIATTWKEVETIITGYNRAEAVGIGNGAIFLNNIEALYDIINKISNTKDLEKAKNIINSIDWTNTDSINKAIRELRELGVEINSNLVDGLIEATGAVSKFNEKTLQEKIEQLETARSAGNKIKEGKTSFSDKEYQALKQTAGDKYNEDGRNWAKDWIQIGLDEWVYIGNETNALLSSIDASVAALLKDSIDERTEQVQRGLEIDKILNPEKKSESKTEEPKTEESKTEESKTKGTKNTTTGGGGMSYGTGGGRADGNSYMGTSAAPAYGMSFGGGGGGGGRFGLNFGMYNYPGRIGIGTTALLNAVQGANVGASGTEESSSNDEPKYEYKYKDKDNPDQMKTTMDPKEFIRMLTAEGAVAEDFDIGSLKYLASILKLDITGKDNNQIFEALRLDVEKWTNLESNQAALAQEERLLSVMMAQNSSNQQLLGQANTYNSDEQTEQERTTAAGILQGRIQSEEIEGTYDVMKTQGLEYAEEHGQKLFDENNLETINQMQNGYKALALVSNEAVKNIDNLNSALNDNWDAFKKATKGTPAYTAALNKLLPALKKVFGDKVDSKWIKEHEDLLDKWAKGGEEAEEAINEFAKEASKSLEGTLEKGIETTNGEVLNLNEHIAELDGSQLEVGATANFGDLNNQLMMTAAQAETTAASLNSIPGVSVVWVKTGTATMPDGSTRETGYFQITKNGAAGSTPPKGGGGGGGKEFKNDFDKYYNQVEDINELIRLRNLLETDYNQLLEAEGTSGKQIYDNLKKQVNLLKERQKLTADLAEKRKGQIFDLLNDKEYKDVKQYAWWNEEDQTIEIDWDAINEIKDSELGDRVKEFVSKLEDFQGKYDEQIEALEEIESTLQEIEKRGRDQYTSFEDRVRDALIQQIQTQIDELTAVNEGISDANQKLFDSIQNTLELQRQERDNAKTEEELSDKEQRLAYLQQDSSGANAVEIAQLQKELEDARESYTDQLIDQKISELQKQNDEAAEQRQEQIDLLQQSLDWQEKNGEFWEQAYQLMNNGIGPDGTLVTGSELEQLLKQGEGWQALSQEGKMNWLSELETMVAEAVGYLYLSRQLEKIGTKAGTEITFTDAEGNTHTGKVDKDGNVVIDNGDGTQTVWKDVYQSYDGSYRTLETEENAKTENKPATSTQQPQQPSQSQKVKYEYKYTGFDYIQHKKYRRVKGSNDSWQYIGLENHDGATSCSKCGWKKPSSSGGGGGGCFAAGTKIIMSDFTAKNIEDVLVGDEVIAYNEEKGLFESKKVIKSYAHYNTSRVIKVILSNNVVLKVTPGHPILTTEGWKSRDIENSLYEHNTIATWLNVGDQVIGYSGIVVVENIVEMEIPNNYITYNIEVEICHTYLADGIVVHNGKFNTVMLYATGGLNTETGPAWLDGTKAHPELVLNARDTENFIQLKDTLADLRKNSVSLGTNGDNYYEISINVDEIGSDYDVDKLADRLRTLIYRDSQYRNVNTLNRLR